MIESTEGRSQQSAVSGQGSRVRKDEWILFGVPPVCGNIPKKRPGLQISKKWTGVVLRMAASFFAMSTLMARRPFSMLDMC